MMERPFYVIATDNSPNAFGVYEGPFADLQLAKRMIGKNDWDALIRFNDDETSTVLFRWNERELRWEAADAQED